MKFTRILSLLLALLMIVGMLAACDNNDADTDADAAEGEETDAAQKLNIITEGQTEYVFVRDYKASDEVKDAINSLLASIKQNIGADMVVRECYNDRPDEPNDIRSEKEILVGMTNRQESIDTLSGYRSKDYTIAIKGSKLVIGSSSDEGTIAALTKFLTEFVSEQGNRWAVRQGELQSLFVSTDNEVYEKGTYSYETTTMAGVRLDSFGLIYPKNAENSDECMKFAQEMAKHISKETGYELKVYKDTRYQCCYEILIGDTVRTDDGILRELGDDEYYIKLEATECTHADHGGQAHPGARLIICWGRNAKSAALYAATSLMFPATQGGESLEFQEGFTLPSN